MAKTYGRGGGHRTYFLDGGTIGAGEKHILGGGDTATHILCLLEDFGGDTAQQKAPS